MSIDQICINLRGISIFIWLVNIGHLVISENFILHFISHFFYYLNCEVIHDMMQKLTTGIKLCQLNEWLVVVCQSYELAALFAVQEL